MSDSNDEAIQRIDLRLIGDENFGPGEIGGRDLAKIIKTLEEMIAYVVSHRHPMSPFDSVKIGLDSIGRGSLNLGFRYHLQPIGDAYRDIGQAVTTGDFSKIPRDTHQKAKELQRTIHQLGCTAELGIGSGQARTIVGEIEELTTIQDPDKEDVIQGSTTVYGRIMRVGGSQKPKVELKIKTSAKLVSCYPRTQGEAKNIASRLYEIVGIRGTATWSLFDMSLLRIEDSTLLNYEEGPITSTLQELSADFGEYFNSIEDPELFIAEQRQTEGGTIEAGGR